MHGKPNFSTAANFILTHFSKIIFFHLCFLIFSAFNFLMFYFPFILFLFLEAIYFDTDSCHILLHHPSLEDNVMPELLQQFQAEKDAYVDSSTKLAGNILVQTCLIYTNIADNNFVFFLGYLLLETVSSGITIYGEKMDSCRSFSGN